MLKAPTLSWLVRYGYGGGLLYLILAIFHTGRVAEVTDAAGSVLAPIITLVVGACIYVVCRHFVGELFLYPGAHAYDWATNPRNRAKTGAVSTFWYLYQMKVPLLDCREAYTALRREYLIGETKNQFDFSHSEVHVLYVTFVEIIVLGFVLWYARGFTRGGWLVFGSLSFLGTAWAADARLHRHEFRTIVPADEKQREPVLKFLKDHGYLGKTTAVSGET
jgi:hypothetical protein